MGSDSSKIQGVALTLNTLWGQVHYLDGFCYKAIVMFAHTYAYKK